jgi:hypothetical protein
MIQMHWLNSLTIWTGPFRLTMSTGDEGEAWQAPLIIQNVGLPKIKIMGIQFIGLKRS